MKELIDILHNEGLTLVIKSRDGIIHRFTQRGVKDLLTLVQDGKAAAACMVMGSVNRVHADVMSEPALALLQAHGITAEYGQLVNHIINRAGTGWCPMELLSRDVDDPAVIIKKMQEFFNKS